MDTKITFKAKQEDEYPYLMIEIEGGYVAMYPKVIVVQRHRPLTVMQDNLTRITISLKEETKMTEKCVDRVQEHLESRIEDLTKLWELSNDDPEANDDDLGNIYEYGLAFDYVAPGTFGDQPEGYFRYQLSWGGPADEFRIYADQSGPHDWAIYRIEYWLLDWFDGASIVLNGQDRELIEDVFQSLFVDTGTASHAYQEAIQ